MATNNALNLLTGASNTLLQGAGVGSPLTYSTATYPSLAGSSGNHLTSNGTNFTSVAPVYTPYAFFIQTLQSAASLADGATLFLASGSTPIFFIAVTGSQRFIAPKAGTLSAVYCIARVNGTLASAGNCTLRYHLNSAAAVDIITTFPLTAADNAVSATGIGLSLAIGDFLNFSILCPTWATNPTLVSFALGAIIT